MNVRQRPNWLRTLANRQFEVKRLASVSFNRTQTDETVVSATRDEPDSTPEDSKADKGYTVTDVEPKSSAVHLALTEMHDTEPSELTTVTNVDNAPDQSDGSLNSDFATLGLKNGKKNKVYAAPIDDDVEFHEA